MQHRGRVGPIMWNRKSYVLAKIGQLISKCKTAIRLENSYKFWKKLYVSDPCTNPGKVSYPFSAHFKSLSKANYSRVIF